MLIKNRMHSRNIYKTPPNFKELAVNYPDFRQYVKQELCGRLTIDYQDPNAVKELTKTLLKRDFNLDVEINENRLIPRVPLCLNYILWIEDLLNTFEPHTDIFGIDIGTGNVCIYSLLAAKKGWKMLATEVDPSNFEYAKNNVEKNNLNNLILLKLVGRSDQLLIGVLDNGINYDFCMCNPPFFDFDEKPENRTHKRIQLKALASEVKSEICVKGGEMMFITKLIKESIQLKEKIKIFTTLVGKKCDFLLLKKELKKYSPKSITFTEFCQGRTIRWGIAWTFLDLQLNKVNETCKKNKKRKMKSNLNFILPNSNLVELDAVINSTEQILSDLQICYKKSQLDKGVSINFKAMKNTWSHQRRKRRSAARAKQNLQKTLDEEAVSSLSEHDTSIFNAKKLKKNIDEPMSEDIIENMNLETNHVEGSILLKSDEKLIIFEVVWLSGNKEYLHQIFQYFKNHWSSVK